MQDSNKTLLIEGAKVLGIELNDRKTDQFTKYARLLVEWNEKINLTAITEEEDIVIKHFLDSLTLLGHLPKERVKLIDVGTGAGFPGIPLNIAGENISVTLLDSLEKRVTFLKDVMNKLSLKNINAVHGRAEDFGHNKDYREKFDISVARAVASLAVLCEYCLPFVKVGGIFAAMKGIDVENELNEAKKAISLLGGELIKVEKFTLPSGNNERSIIMIRKCRQTPSTYPRKSGKPTKSPVI